MPLTNTTHRAIRLAVADTLPPSQRNAWMGSPFEWMLRDDVDFQVAGQALFERLCEFHLGKSLIRSSRGNGNYILPDHGVLKLNVALSERSFTFSVPTKVAGPGHYDVFVALAVAPTDAAIWSIPRADLVKRLGYDGNPEVSDIEFVLDMSDLPEWSEKCGGTIERGLAALVRLL